MVRRFLLIVLLAAPGAVRAGETYRLVSDARYATAGADGSVFVLTDKRDPTPGAWMQDCSRSPDSLTRLDGETGTVLWSTCLPIHAENFAVDAHGAVTIAGGTSSMGSMPATPNAYTSRGGDGIVVIRLNSAGTGPDWVANLAGDSAYPYSSARTRIATGPDGSVYGLATVTTTNLPVTGEAIATARSSHYSGYFFRLSAEGSKLLYATYVNDGNECGASDLVADGEGSVFLGGSCSSFWLDYKSSMATPGTFTTARNMWMQSAWVARFDPSASAFRYICVFGQLSGGRIALAPTGQGRVAIAGTMLRGLLTPTAGALTAGRATQSGDTESFVVVLNSEGSAADSVASFGLAEVRSLETDANGDMILAGEASLITTTANAAQLVGGAAHDSNFVLKLTADGSRVIYATGIGCGSCEIQSLTRAGDTLWIASSDKSRKLTVGEARPATVSPRELSVVRAMPDNWSQVVAFEGATLSWDTRDPAVLSAEIRLGIPSGPVVARGTTGAIRLTSDTATYYFVDTTGGATGEPHVLGVDTFTQYRALGGILAYYGYFLSLDSNPVLSCREAPLSGTQVNLKGHSGGSGLTAIRVNASDGPVLTSGWGLVHETTGDWVQNGMPFFLTTIADGQTLGSVRAYLLPNRPCAPDAPPEPMIRSTRDCVQTSRFTLAWYAGTAPVEIREGSPAGPKVGRFRSASGLLDVTAENAKTYWLMSWQDGDWKPIASAVADPQARCEQGLVR